MVCFCAGHEDEQPSLASRVTRGKSAGRCGCTRVTRARRSRRAGMVGMAATCALSKASMRMLGLPNPDSRDPCSQFCSKSCSPESSGSLGCGVVGVAHPYTSNTRLPILRSLLCSCQPWFLRCPAAALQPFPRNCLLHHPFPSPLKLKSSASSKAKQHKLIRCSKTASRLPDQTARHSLGTSCSWSPGSFEYTCCRRRGSTW